MSRMRGRGVSGRLIINETEGYYDEPQLGLILFRLIWPVVIHAFSVILESRYSGNMLTEMNRKNEHVKLSGFLLSSQ